MSQTMVRMAERFIKDRKGNDSVPEHGNTNWYELLANVSLEHQDFLDEYFPNLKEDPANLFSVLAARNPNSILLSEVAFSSLRQSSGSFNSGPLENDPCTANVSDEASHPCGDDPTLTYDNHTGFCFKTSDGILVPYEDVEEECNDYVGFLVESWDHQSLAALKSMITNKTGMNKKIFYLEIEANVFFSLFKCQCILWLIPHFG